MRKSEFQASKRAELAERLREVREDLYGEHGSQFMADALNVPLQTWLNYESGIAVPAEIVLQLQVLGSVSAVAFEWRGREVSLHRRACDQE